MTLTIPEEWKLDNRIVQKAGNCVLDVPKLVLSTEELNITDMSASSLLKRLQTGELSSYTVTKAFCHRACIGHQLTNCLTSLFCDEALSRAIELDNHFKEHGPVGPLHGLPVSFKDAFLIRGHKTTFGYLSWKDNVSERDGLPVSIMKSLGVVPFCQTNIAQGLLSVESTNNIFGTVLNPHNTNLTASGSSGGEAALVAMKGSPFGMCTDAGGSIRLPASSNGVYGYMPSPRRISNRGIGRDNPKPSSWVESQIGPVSGDLDSIEIWLKAMIEADMSRYDFRCLPSFWRAAALPRKYRIGFLYQDGITDLTPPMKRGLDIVWNAIAPQHEVFEVDVGDLHRKITETVFRLYVSDGGRYYRSEIAKSGEPMIPRTCGTVISEPLSADEIIELECKAACYADQYLRIFRSYQMDALITAPSPNPAAPHSRYSTSSLAAVYNCLGYPAGIIPVAKVDLTKDQPTPSPRIIQDLRVKGYPYDFFDGYIKKELYTDAKTFENAPICIQVVNTRFKDEELLQIMKVIDNLVKSQI